MDIHKIREHRNNPHFILFNSNKYVVVSNFVIVLVQYVTMDIEGHFYKVIYINEYKRKKMSPYQWTL